MSPTPGPMEAWDDYIERFHTGRAGVTEDLLERCLDGRGRTAYDWVSEDLPDGPVIDLGCGSGPARSMVRRWIGVDRSAAELDLARHLGRRPLVEASASDLPFRDRAAGAALAVMSLMVLSDPAAAVAELARVLERGAVLQVLLPADSPLTRTDRARYGLLLALLGRRSLPFPHPEVAAGPGTLLARAGFEVVSDQGRRFCFTAADSGDTDLFFDSLYMPGVRARRRRIARTSMRLFGRGDIGVPLRRVRARLAE